MDVAKGGKVREGREEDRRGRGKGGGGGVTYLNFFFFFFIPRDKMHLWPTYSYIFHSAKTDLDKAIARPQDPVMLHLSYDT